jgi:hypothetical protein
MSWPYDSGQGQVVPAPQSPDWTCPDGVCECAPLGGEDDAYELSVMLCAHDGERMPGARCRVLVHGKVVNEDTPHADGEGWITVALAHAPQTVLLEWAPPDTPADPIYPYRRYYFVDTRADDDEGLRRRLHNLGYTKHRSVAENVATFQRDYGLPTSGRIADIETELVTFHDEGRVPVRSLGGGWLGDVPAPDEGPSASDAPALADTDSAGLGKGTLGAPDKGFSLLPGAPGAKSGAGGDKAPPPAKKAPPASPAPRATKGNTPLGLGTAMFPEHFPTVAKAIQDNKAYYEFVRVFVKGTKKEKARPGEKPKTKDVAAFFWIFGEALMWPVPDGEAWKDWKESHSLLPHTPHSGLALSAAQRKRLCRLPCTSAESQAAADLIKVSQAELLRVSPDMADRFPVKNDKRLGCLLPTPKVYDALYLGADIRFLYRYVDGMDKRSLENMSNEFNWGMNEERIKPALAKASLKGPLKSIGTPGKIWAIATRMDTSQTNPENGAKYICAINYGFHEGNAKPTVKQTAGARHDQRHKDYSQILVLVAGHCLVMGPDDTDYAWRTTESVYLSKDLGDLVHAFELNPGVARYPTTPR